jgi:endonuclease/exonuclease/phosphatase (EEP) superfamily protein YafD
VLPAASPPPVPVGPFEPPPPHAPAAIRPAAIARKRQFVNNLSTGAHLTPVARREADQVTGPSRARADAMPAVTCRSPRWGAASIAMLPWQAVAIPAALMVALLSTGCSHAPERQPAAPGPRPTLRLMTYNVNFGIAGDAPTLAAIESGGADVVFLQEISKQWETSLRATFGARYPHVVFYPRGGAGGIGAMSRLPIRAHQLLASEGDGWFPALRLVLDSPLGALQVLVVHLRPPVSDGGSFISGHFTAPAIHEKEIARFCETLDRDLPTMVVGDFNEEEDGRAVAYLASAAWKMKSALPEFAPDRPTWRWPTTFHTFERRLDHIVYDGRLEPLKVEVLDAGRSDHFPVVGVFVRARAPM